MTTRDIGQAFDKKAEIYLRGQGYEIISRNFQSKFGEIDLIVLKDDTLVFIEVRARGSDLFGLPEEAVTKRKIAHISLAGECYASLHPELPKLQRIDVVAIEGDQVRLIEVS